MTTTRHAAILLLMTTIAPAAMSDPPSVEVIPPGGGEHLWVFAEADGRLGTGGEFHVYVDPRTHPDARASFARFALGDGGELPVHRHDTTEEIGYFLEGEGAAVLVENGETVEIPVQAGSVMYVPPGTWHAIRNTGEGPLALVFATIPNREQGLMTFFRSIATEPGKAGEALPPEEFASLAAEHDLVLRPAGESTQD